MVKVLVYRNIGLALSRGCIEMTWRESDEVTEIADELEERERIHIVRNPSTYRGYKILLECPRHAVIEHDPFSSSPREVTTLALRSLGDV
jgi:hypothetical protein